MDLNQIDILLSICYKQTQDINNKRNDGAGRGSTWKLLSSQSSCKPKTANYLKPIYLKQSIFDTLKGVR